MSEEIDFLDEDAEELAVTTACFVIDNASEFSTTPGPVFVHLLELVLMRSLFENYKPESWATILDQIKENVASGLENIKEAVDEQEDQPTAGSC